MIDHENFFMHFWIVERGRENFGTTKKSNSIIAWFLPLLILPEISRLIFFKKIQVYYLAILKHRDTLWWMRGGKIFFRTRGSLSIWDERGFLSCFSGARTLLVFLFIFFNQLFKFKSNFRKKYSIWVNCVSEHYCAGGMKVRMGGNRIYKMADDISLGSVRKNIFVLINFDFGGRSEIVFWV